MHTAHMPPDTALAKEVPIAGAVLKAARERRKWSQRKLEMRSGISQGQISKLEKAALTYSRRDTAEALARELDVTLEDLAGTTHGSEAPLSDEETVRQAQTLLLDAIKDLPAETISKLATVIREMQQEDRNGIG